MEVSRTQYIGQGTVGLADNAAFVAKVHACVASGFERPDFDENDTRYHLLADYVDIARDTNRRVVGFLSAKFGKAEDMLPGVDLGDVSQEEVAYLFGTAVSPEVKSNGVYTSLAASFIEEAKSRGLGVILFSTQNPHVEAGFDKALAKLGQSALKERVPIPGRYGRLLTGELPVPIRNAGIQAAYEGLRRDVGDAFAVIYRLPTAPGEGRRNPF